MKGSMRQRGKNAWELRVFTGTDINGKKRWAYRTFHGGQREAETALAAFVTEAADHRVPVSGGMTLAQYLAKWLIARRMVVSQATIIIQQGIIDRHINPHLGRKKLARLTALDVENLYAHLAETLALKTIEGVHSVLDKAYSDAFRKGTVTHNPIKLVERSRSEQPDIAVPPREDVFQAIATAPPIVGMGMSIIAATGLRRGELLALRWSEIDLDRGLVRVNRNLQYIQKQIVIKPPKTKASKRTVALPASMAAGLREYRAWQREEHLRLGIRTDLVIHNRKGEPYKPTTYSAAVKEAGDRVGLVNLGPHSLRHMHATYLMEQGIHPRVVQERLGHANISTTLTVYSHVLDHMQDRAAEAADGLTACPSFCPSKS